MPIRHKGNAMDLRHIRTFVIVAELGTVSKAAQRLRVAQPALSRQISDLEQELGFRLFDRVGRRLALTSGGEQFLGDCRGLLNHADAVGERAQLLRRGDTGVLKLAASPQHIESVLSQFLHRYAQRFPNVELKIIEAAGRESLAMLERREIHLAQNSASCNRAERPAVREHATRTGRVARGLPSNVGSWQGWSHRSQ